MKRKLISALAVSLSCVMLLGGCGKSEDDKPQTGDDNNGGSQVEEQATEGYIAATDASLNPSVALDRKDTLIIGTVAPDEVFNPLYSESAYDDYLVQTMFEGLVEADGKGMPVENIATYEVSEDNLTYTFTIKDGVNFWDGTPVTAEDVAFTYTVLCDPAYDGVIDVVSSGTKIKGAKAYQDGTATSVEGIKVIDDKTISFTLDEVNADALYDLGAGVISKAYYGAEYAQGNLDYIKEFHKAPMGSGQYKFVSSSAGQEVVLEANEDYFLGAPNVPNVIFKVTTSTTQMQMLQTGEIDMDMITVSQDNVGSLSGAGFLDLCIFPTNGYGYIGLNNNDPKFEDPKVRQALAYGLDRASIVEASFTGGYADVINVPQSKESWAYSEVENDYAYNPEKAAELLDEAGWVVGDDGIREKDGVKLEIRFTASTPNDVNDAIIPVAQQCYEALNIGFEAEQMDFNSVMAKANAGEADMYFMAWGLTPSPDPSGTFSTTGAQNYVGYSSAKVDELSEKALKETDTEARKDIYAEIWQELNNDLPYIYLYQRRDMWAINSRVKGFDGEITPYNDFANTLYKVTIE